MTLDSDLGEQWASRRVDGGLACSVDDELHVLADDVARAQIWLAFLCAFVGLR